MGNRITHHPALAHPALAHLKLGFNQQQQIHGCLRLQQRQEGRQHQGQGNKRHICHR